MPHTSEFSSRSLDPDRIALEREREIREGKLAEAREKLERSQRQHDAATNRFTKKFFEWRVSRYTHEVNWDREYSDKLGEVLGVGSEPTSPEADEPSSEVYAGEVVDLATDESAIELGEQVLPPPRLDMPPAITEADVLSVAQASHETDFTS